MWDTPPTGIYSLFSSLSEVAFFLSNDTAIISQTSICVLFIGVRPSRGVQAQVFLHNWFGEKGSQTVIKLLLFLRSRQTANRYFKISDSEIFNIGLLCSKLKLCGTVSTNSIPPPPSLPPAF